MERGQAAMARRNYLVERNRLRRAKYEETRRALETEDLKVASERAAEKQERVDAWQATAATMNTSEGKTRPHVGGGPHRGRDPADLPTTMYRQEQAEQARRKAEYRAVYEADVKQQVAMRQLTLKQQKDAEDHQSAALHELNTEASRKAADADFQRKEENKAYLSRVHKSNEREIAARNKRDAERMAAERTTQRLLQENNRHRTEMEEMQRKNAIKSYQLQNTENKKEASRRSNDNRAREAAELATVVALDRAAAQRDQEANEAKKERFRSEFDDSVKREKEFRRTHNYDEPAHVTRQRNELAAEAYRLMCQEQALITAQRKAEYERDLMDQIIARQDYAVTHLDEV